MIGLTNIQYELQLLAKAEQFPHILFDGPRGTGKTTLAHFIQGLTGNRFREFNCASLDKEKLYQILLSTKRGDIIFFDEIHALRPQVEEILYSPLEGDTITLPFKNRVVTTNFPRFTLIGATTRLGMISKPLLSRFKVHMSIPMYTTRELARIILAKHAQLSTRDALSIARCTLVPRDAIALSDRLALLQMPIEKGLKFLHYNDGLSMEELNFLKVLNNGELSMQSLSGMLQLEKDSVGVIEERLMYLGLVEVTGRGRKLTLKGIQRLNNV